jgi:hypothetical protein
MDERRRLERLTGQFAGEFLLGHAVEFRIDEMEQLFPRIALATVGGFEKARHIAHARQRSKNPSAGQAT